MYNVKEYGVLGDGVTDDTIAIQALVDSVNLAGGGIINFPKSTYFITAPIILKSNVTITGDGIDLTIFDLKSGIFNAFTTPTPTLIPMTQTADIITGGVSNAISNSLQPGDMICYSSTDMFTAPWTASVIRTYYTKGELFEVKSATSSVLTFTELAYLTMPVSTSKPVEAFTPTKNIYISDLSIVRDGDTTSPSIGIDLHHCNGVVIERVKTLKNNYAGIMVNRSFNVTIRTAYLVGGTADIGLDYGVVVVDGSKRVYMSDIHTSSCRHGIAGGGSGYACPMYVYANGIFVENSFATSLDAHACCAFFTYENAFVDNGCGLSGIGHVLKNIKSSAGTPFAYDGGIDLVLDNVNFSNCRGWYTNKPIAGMTVRDCKLVISDPSFKVTLSLNGCTNVKFYNTSIIRKGYDNNTTVAQNEAMFETVYAFIMNDNCAMVDCYIEGFPSSIYVNGSNCVLKNLTLRNCGWSSVLTATPCNIAINKNASFSTLDGIVIENINKGFAYASRTIRFDNIGTGSGGYISLTSVRHGRYNEIIPYYGLYVDVNFKNMFLLNNQIVAGSGGSTINGTGKYINNNFIANN